MIRAANLLAEARRVAAMAGQPGARPTGPRSPAVSGTRRPTAGTTRWRSSGSPVRAASSSGARGRLVGPRTVAVGDRVFAAARGVVVGTGTRPAIPPVAGLADTPLWTNRDAIEVETLPESLIVLGGGSIGVELAQVFARFGVAVSVVEAADRLIAIEEPEASDAGQPGARTRRGTGLVGRPGRAGRPRRAPGSGSTSPDGSTLGCAAAAGRDRPPPGPARARARRGRARSRRPRPCRSTSGCGPLTGCGGSAMSPAMARSPTSRCTRPASRYATSSGRSGRRPTTGPCPG